MKLKRSSNEGFLMKVFSHSLMWLSKHCSGHYVTTQACTIILWGCGHLRWCGALENYTLCMRNPQFYVSGKRFIRQTMTSDSYFWFNDGNKMKDIYSHNHQMRNWYAKAHKSTYRVKDNWENLIDLRHTYDRIKPNKNFDRYLWSTEYDNTITSDIQPHDMTTMGNVDNSDDSIDDDNKMSYRYIISII